MLTVCWLLVTTPGLPLPPPPNPPTPTTHTQVVTLRGSGGSARKTPATVDRGSAAAGVATQHPGLFRHVMDAQLALAPPGGAPRALQLGPGALLGTPGLAGRAFKGFAGKVGVRFCGLQYPGCAGRRSCSWVVPAGPPGLTSASAPAPQRRRAAWRRAWAPQPRTCSWPSAFGGLTCFYFLWLC